MDAKQLYQHVKAQGGFLHLTGRAFYELTGADRVRYLNGQTTNRVPSAPSTQSIYACVLTAKGKLCADLFVSATEDALRIDTTEELRESLFERLDRYIIADDVTLSDLTDERTLFHILGTECPADLPTEPLSVTECERFGQPGIDLLMHARDAGATAAHLSLQLAEITSDLLDTLCVEAGIPRWGRELTPESIPVEAGIADRAIDYAKGCYIGQEVISRLKSIGSPSKHLRRLLPMEDLALQPDMQLFLRSAGQNLSEKPIGRITSTGFSFALDKTVALGYVKRGCETPGTLLETVSDNQQDRSLVEVTELTHL